MSLHGPLCKNDAFLSFALSFSFPFLIATTPLIYRSLLSLNYSTPLCGSFLPAFFYGLRQLSQRFYLHSLPAFICHFSSSLLPNTQRKPPHLPITGVGFRLGYVVRGGDFWKVALSALWLLPLSNCYPPRVFVRLAFCLLVESFTPVLFWHFPRPPQVVSLLFCACARFRKPHGPLSMGTQRGSQDRRVFSVKAQPARH